MTYSFQRANPTMCGIPMHLMGPGSEYFETITSHPMHAVLAANAIILGPMIPLQLLTVYLNQKKTRKWRLARAAARLPALTIAVLIELLGSTLCGLLLLFHLDVPSPIARRGGLITMCITFGLVVVGLMALSSKLANPLRIVHTPAKEVKNRIKYMLAPRGTVTPKRQHQLWGGLIGAGKSPRMAFIVALLPLWAVLPFVIGFAVGHHSCRSGHVAGGTMALLMQMLFIITVPLRRIVSNMTYMAYFAIVSSCFFISAGFPRLTNTALNAATGTYLLLTGFHIAHQYGEGLWMLMLTIQTQPKQRYRSVPAIAEDFPGVDGAQELLLFKENEPLE